MVGSQEYSKAYLGSELFWDGYTILTPDMVSGRLGSSSQRYIGTATHLIIDDSFPTDSLHSLFRDNQTLKSLVILTNKFTSMAFMFYGSPATSLDLSSFDTSNVTTMYAMFSESQATTLDLSSFDTSNVVNMGSMFRDSQATTCYVRTQADADRFNTSSGNPVGLTFIVKPEPTE